MTSNYILSRIKMLSERKLLGIFAFLQSLRHSLKKKEVYIYTDSEPFKYMLINMRAKLKRPDLQLQINEMRKICVEPEIIPQVEHIPGKQTVIPNALTRNEPIPDNLAHNGTNITSATNSVQVAADLCCNILIDEEQLHYDETIFLFVFMVKFPRTVLHSVLMG